MRIIIDIMIALMLVAVVAGGFIIYNNRQQDERDIETVRAALHQLHEQAAYHTTVQSAMAGRDTMLVHLHPEWFGEDLPTNVLLKEGHPWLDLAPPGDLGLNPPDPVVSNQSQAGFWYNPTTGVFRARVVPGSSEAETLALYNEINGTSLDAFEQLPDPARRPIAHVPGQTPSKQYASMANKTWSEPVPTDDAIPDELIVPESEADQSVSAPAVDGDADPIPAAPISGKNETDTHEFQPDAVSHVEVLDEAPSRPTLKKD